MDECCFDIPEAERRRGVDDPCRSCREPRKAKCPAPKWMRRSWVRYRASNIPTITFKVLRGISLIPAFAVLIVGLWAFLVLALLSLQIIGGFAGLALNYVAF